MNNFDVTYYLCALAHLNQSFREMVINEFIDEEYKALGISYGVDIVPVIKHCVAANRSQFIRDLLLTFCLIAILVFLGNKSYFLCILFILLSWFIVFTQLFLAHLFTAKIALIPNRAIALLNKKHDFSKIKHKLKKADDAQYSNVIIYNNFLPFIGFGLNLDRWSFAIDINKKKELNSQLYPCAFEAKELYLFVSDQVYELNIKSLKIEDKLFVDGKSSYELENLHLLPSQFNRPLSNIKDKIVNYYIDNHNDNIRYYKCFHVTLWDGALILSIFLKFTKIKQNLYVEFNNYLLTPLKEEYCKTVDSIKELSRLKKISEIAGKTTFKFLFLLIISPLIFFTKVFSLFTSKEDSQTKELIRKKLFNYGASTSLREKISASEYQRYFQLADQDMYTKIVQRRILDAITEFLDEKGIDTSDLNDRTTAILNNGVIVSGGSVNTENLTVGKQAKSTIINNKEFVKYRFYKPNQ
jgi:hypothetical protein